jgi:hypothetical protein
MAAKTPRRPVVPGMSIGLAAPLDDLEEPLEVLVPSSPEVLLSVSPLHVYSPLMIWSSPWMPSKLAQELSMFLLEIIVKAP